MNLKQVKGLRYNQTVYMVGHYGSDGRAVRARVTGKVKTWVTRPNEVQVPIKHGLYDSGYLTERNMDKFTTKEPAKRKKSKK